MGERGPIPKPTKLRLIDGTAESHPERINPAEPKPATADATPPAWLSGERERATYHELAGKLDRMGLLTEADQHALGQLAMYWVRWHELAEGVETDVTETQSGYRMTDPRINSMVKIGEKVVQLMKEFGLTPSSRTRISVPEQAPADPLEDYLSDAN
jgi:P27 family predicted phage terminase small subunit